MSSPGSGSGSSYEGTRMTQSTVAGILSQIALKIRKPPPPPPKPADWTGPGLSDFQQRRNTIPLQKKPTDTTFTKSQERFLTALSFGIAGLAYEMKSFAKERIPGSGHAEEGRSWQSVVDDLESDSSSIYAMLLQLPPAIHRHLIAGDLFHAKANSWRLRQFYDSMMGPLVALPGSYGQAIVDQRKKHTNEGCWLSANNTKEFADAMLRYVTDFTQSGNDFAKEIATATTEPKEDREKRERDPKYRRYASTDGLQKAFKTWARLAVKSYHTDVTPLDRNIPFVRSPTESGWAKNVKKRLEAQQYKNISANNFVAFARAWLVWNRKSGTLKEIRYVSPVGFHIFCAWEADKEVAQFTELLAHAVYCTRLSTAAGGELGLNHVSAPWISKVSSNGNYNLSLSRSTAGNVRAAAEADARLLQKLHDQAGRFTANVRLLSDLKDQISTEIRKWEDLKLTCEHVDEEITEKREERRLAKESWDARLDARLDDTQKERTHAADALKEWGAEVLARRDRLSVPLFTFEEALQEYQRDKVENNATYEAGVDEARRVYDDFICDHETLLARTTGTQHTISSLVPLGSQLPADFDAGEADGEDTLEEEAQVIATEGEDEDLGTDSLLSDLGQLSISWNAIGKSFPLGRQPAAVDYQEAFHRMKPNTAGLSQIDAISKLQESLRSLKPWRQAEEYFDSEGESSDAKED